MLSDSDIEKMGTLSEKCSIDNRGGLCYPNNDNQILAYKPSQICGEQAFDEVYKKRSANPDKGIWLSLNAYWIVPVIIIGVIILFGILAYIGWVYSIMWLFFSSLIIGLILVSITNWIINKFTGGNIVGGVVSGYYIAKGVKQANVGKCMTQVDRYAKAYINSPANTTTQMHVITNNRTKILDGQLEDNDLVFYYTNKGKWNPSWDKKTQDVDTKEITRQQFTQSEFTRLAELEKQRGIVQGQTEATLMNRATGSSGSSSGNVAGNIAGAVIGAAIISALKKK